MKSLNHKQIKAYNNKVMCSRLGAVKKLLFSVFFVFFVAMLFQVVVSPSIQTLTDLLGFGVPGGIITALVGMVSVSAGTSAEKSGKQTRYRVWLLHKDQADQYNIPTADKDAGTLADLPRVTGEYWHYLDCMINSVIPNFKSDGDLGTDVTNEVKLTLEGLSTNNRKFLNKFKGEYFYIVWEACATGTKYIAGTKCAPLKLTIDDGGWNSDATGAKITFKNSCPDIPYEYLGNVTESAAATIAADATTKALGVENEYQFSANTGAKNFTAFTGMTSADHGRIITVFGASTSTNATTIDTDDSFDLKDGVIWTANPGSKISFKIFKSGSSTYRFIEVDNTRIQG